MLQAYLARIGLTQPLPADPLQLLSALHAAHLAAIPFENFSQHLGQPVRLEPEALFEKLVVQKRGGYCFEQNLLAWYLLRELGFEPKLRGARTVAEGKLRPLTHLVLELEIEGRGIIFDVGYGGNGLRFPQRLDGQPQDQQFYKARARRESTQWVLEKQLPGASDWQPICLIQNFDFLLLDCRVANHYIATHPDSIFSKTVTAQIVLPDRRISYRLSDKLLRTELSAAGEHTQQPDPAQAMADIAANFGYAKEFLPSIETLFTRENYGFSGALPRSAAQVR